MYFFNLRLTCILILIFYKYFQDARHQKYLFHGELLYWRSGVVIFTSSYNIYENMHHTSYALQYAIKM